MSNFDYFGLISCWKYVSGSDSFHIGQGCFKTEIIYQHTQLLDMLEMKWLVDEFIGYYNHDRPHSFNDYLSPVKFEQVRLDQIIEIENGLGTK